MSKGPSITTSLAQEVNLEPRVKAFIRVQLTEYQSLQKKIKELEAKQAEIKQSVTDKFIDADQIDALMAGADIDGIKVKMVAGTRRELDKMRLMKKHGLSQADLDECTIEKANKPYVKISTEKE
jgi:hypothetical protein